MFRITDKSLFVQRIAFIEEIGTLSTTGRFLSSAGPHRFTGRIKLPRSLQIELPSDSSTTHGGSFVKTKRVSETSAASELSV